MKKKSNKQMVLFLFTIIGLFGIISCKKNSNFNSKSVDSNLKNWLKTQPKNSILKEEFTLEENQKKTVYFLDWTQQKKYRKGNLEITEVPYKLRNVNITTEQFLVFAINNEGNISAKMKNKDIILQNDNYYSSETFFDANGEMSEMWLWKNNKFYKAQLNSANSSEITNSGTNVNTENNNCTLTSYKYYTYSYPTDPSIVGIIMHRHTVTRTICFTLSGETTTIDYINNDDLGGTLTTTVMEDTISDSFDKPCLDNAFDLILNTENLGGVNLFQSLKNIFNSQKKNITWKNDSLGTSNSNLYSIATLSNTGVINVTLNYSLLKTASKEYISATILNSYYQGYTAWQGNSWTNNLDLVSDALSSIALGVRQLHSSLPFGAEYAIALRVFYDNNENIINQTNIGAHLNQYFNSLVTLSKIPTTQGPVGTVPTAEYNGWQVAKNVIGLKYATNNTLGTTSNCN